MQERNQDFAKREFELKEIFCTSCLNWSDLEQLGGTQAYHRWGLKAETPSHWRPWGFGNKTYLQSRGDFCKFSKNSHFNTIWNTFSKFLYRFGFGRKTVTEVNC